MKFLSRVVWSEGMYLGPHHFQTQSRYFEDLLAFVGSNLWNQPWGLLRYQLDDQAIRNGNAVLLHASGIFPDGLTFDIPDCDPPPPCTNLLELVGLTEGEIQIHLAVPRRRDNGTDSDLSGTISDSRYSVMQRTLRDETGGVDEYAIEMGRKNLRIVTDAQLTPDLVSLPLARVFRDRVGGLIYDAEFIPACLRIDASEALLLMLKRLVEIIHEKSRAMKAGDARQGQFEVGISPLEVANYWFLHALNSSLPVLNHRLLTKGSHPVELYQELLRLGGALCTFAIDSDPMQLPAYEPREAGRVFRALDQHIRKHLEIIVPSNAVTLKFQGTSPYFYEAEITDERCFRRSRWILGVRSGLKESELLRLVPQLIKVCSAKFVAELVKRALPGMPLLHIPVPPVAMRAHADMHYFSISTTGPCWEHILQTRRVGVYIPGEISNPGFDLTVILEAS
jgi:type VI secretion system protein ImpJ